MQNKDIHERCERLVRNDVYVCLSSLVSTLAQGYGADIFGEGRQQQPASNLRELVEQAFELASPVLDYEEAAREAGWTVDEGGYWTHLTGDEEGKKVTVRTAEEACAFHGTEPYEREVFEHWAVSARLANDLAELGEKVELDFAGMCVWARTTTGQGIAADSVIRNVIGLIDKRVKELA